MKYSLQLKVISNNTGLRTAVRNILPDIDHPHVFDDGNPNTYVVVEDVGMDGNAYLFANIRFAIEADRDGFTSSVKGITGIINQCLDGSYVDEVKDGHFQTPFIKCEVQTSLRP